MNQKVTDILDKFYSNFALEYDKSRFIFDMSDIIEEFYRKAKVKNGTYLDLGCGVGEPFVKSFIEKG